MSTIFSPSAYLMKNPTIHRENVSPIPKGKSTIEKDELLTSSVGCSQKRSISLPEWELFWWHTSICSLLRFSKDVSCLPLFRKFRCYFTRNSSERRAIWLICMATFAVRWRYSTCQASWLSYEKFDHSVVMWLGEIHPICPDNETAWQGHNSNYFVSRILSWSN